MADNLEHENADDNSDDLQRVIAELGGDSDGAVVRLLRLEKAGARTGAVIADMDPQEFSFMEVKTRYGGGHYRAKLTRANGQLIRNQAFSLEGRPKIADEAQPAPAVQAQSARDADPMLAMMNMQMQMMREQSKENQTFMRDFLMAMRTAQQSAPVAPPPPAFGPQEMIGLISAMMPLFSQKQTADPIAALTQGIQLGKEMAGGGGDDDSALGILSKGLDTLGPLVSRIASAPPAPPASVAAIPARRAQRPAPPEARPDPAISMSAEQKEIYSMMKMLAGAALTSAGAGEDPSAMVANYGSLVPAAYRNALVDPKIVDALVKVEPALEPHRDWLDRLREAFRESYASPLDRAADEGIKVNYGPPVS